MARLAIALSSCALFLLPTAAVAHTRWFAHEMVPPYMTSEPTALYLSVWALVAFMIIVLGVYLERRGALSLSFLLPRAPHAFDRAASTFSMVAGAFFLIAGTHEYLFSPNLSIESGIPVAYVVAQIFIGLAFLVGVYARVAALLLILLWAAAFPVAGTLAMLEDVWVLGTGLFILIVGNDYFSIVNFKLLKRYMRPYHDYALPILRVSTGVTLLTLGLSEKIFAPELGINFLAQYDWNFMQMAGFSWYTDYLFTLSAGAVEALFGVVFLLGIMTRVNALVLAIFFTTPLFILGPIELAGHLPHFAAVLMLLFFGSGHYLTITRPSPRRRVRVA